MADRRLDRSLRSSSSGDHHRNGDTARRRRREEREAESVAGGAVRSMAAEDREAAAVSVRGGMRALERSGAVRGGRRSYPEARDGARRGYGRGGGEER